MRALRLTLRSLLTVASVSTLLATGMGWAALDKLRGEVPLSQVLSDNRMLVESPQAPPADDGATDILLVGNDSRTDNQGRPLPLSVLKALRTESTTGMNTDSLILLRVPHNGGAPTAVSIPRDTAVPALGTAPDQPNPPVEKINGMYGLAKSAASKQLHREDPQASSQQLEQQSNLAGQRALVASAQALSGVRVDHYAEVNLLGFYEVTEALGGVEVCLNQSTSDKDSGASFPAGRQTIAGGDALSFVRQRHGLPRGDLDRIVRQQVFLAAVMNKVLSTGTLMDPAKLDRLMVAAQKSVVLDAGWDVVAFAQQMQGLATGGVQFVTLPVVSTNTLDARGQSMVMTNPLQVRNFFASLIQPSPQAPPAQAPAPGAPNPNMNVPAGTRPNAAVPGARPLPQQAGDITSRGMRCVN